MLISSIREVESYLEKKLAKHTINKKNVRMYKISFVAYLLTDVFSALGFMIYAIWPNSLLTAEINLFTQIATIMASFVA